MHVQRTKPQAVAPRMQASSASFSLRRPSCGRIWARLLAALHEARDKEAKRLIRKYRHLVPQGSDVELPDYRSDSSTSRQSSQAGKP